MAFCLSLILCSSSVRAVRTVDGEVLWSASIGAIHPSAAFIRTDEDDDLSAENGILATSDGVLVGVWREGQEEDDNNVDGGYDNIDDEENIVSSSWRLTFSSPTVAVFRISPNGGLRHVGLHNKQVSNVYACVLRCGTLQ